jgi:hypothetical protein
MIFQTAKEFVSAAAELGQMALAMRPDEADPYRNQRDLIRYHLYAAQTKAREIAEALAAKERQ